MSRISKKQRKANIENAKGSPGPKTDEGKSVVRGNALKHGLLAQSVVVNINGFGETQEEFDSMLAQLHVDCGPVGLQEEMLVEKIAITYWRLRRALRAEVGIISKGWNSELECLETTPYPAPTIDLVEGATPLMFSYARSLRGINTILALLKSTEIEIAEKGVVSEPTQKYLYQVFGKSDSSVARKVFMNCYFISDGKRLREEDPERNKSIPDPEACTVAMAEELKAMWDHYDSMVPNMEEYERERTRINRLVLSAPTNHEAVVLQRYVTHLERQLHKDMDQLERLQRRRLGDAVPPPINLNVTTDIEPRVQ